MTAANGQQADRIDFIRHGLERWRGQDRAKILAEARRINRNYLRDVVPEEEISSVVDEVVRGVVLDSLASGTTTPLISERYAGRRVNLAKVLAEPPKPVPWRVKDLVADGTLTIISGQSTAGKSWLAQALCSGVAHGRSVAGLMCAKGQALYFDGEMGPAMFVDQRLRPPGVTVPEFEYIDAIGLDVSKPDDLSWLRGEIEVIGAELVVIDSLRRLVPSKCENDSDDMAPTVAALAKLARDTGAAIVLLHHKGDSDKFYRGSTAIRDQADALFALLREDDESDDNPVRRLRCRGGKGKMRYAPEPPDVFMEISPGDGGVVATDPPEDAGPVVPVRESIKASIKAALPAKTKTDIAGKVGRRTDDKTFRDAWNELRASEELIEINGVWQGGGSSPTLGVGTTTPSPRTVTVTGRRPISSGSNARTKAVRREQPTNDCGATRGPLAGQCCSRLPARPTGSDSRGRARPLLPVQARGDRALRGLLQCRSRGSGRRRLTRVTLRSEEKRPGGAGDAPGPDHGGISMASAQPTGYVRIIERKHGPVAYAKLKLPDGTQPCPKLGKLWTKRTRPPAGYLTRAQAEARLAAILAGDDPLVNIAPSHVTFKAACEEHLRYLQHDRQRKPSYLKDCRNAIRCYLLPALGESTAVEEITTADVDALRARLLSSSLAHKTVHKVLTLLHGILGRAKRKGWISANPCDDAEKVTVKRDDEFNVLSIEEVHAVARAARSDLLAALFTVAAFTGLRQGELLALRWRHVDFANRILHVRRNLPAGTDSEDTPKSHRVRSVPLSDQALIALDGLSRREHFTSDDDLAFGTPVVGHLNDDAVRDAFYAALDASGLGRLRSKEQPIVFHDVRHTFGTTCAAKGIDLRRIQAWMGHADIQTTMRYLHYVPQHDDAARLTAAFAGDANPNLNRSSYGVQNSPANS